MLRMLAMHLFHIEPRIFQGPAQKSQPSIKAVRAGDKAAPRAAPALNVLGMCSALNHPPGAAGDEAEPQKKLQGEEEQEIIMLSSTRRRSHARRKKALARAQVREGGLDP